MAMNNNNALIDPSFLLPFPYNHPLYNYDILLLPGGIDPGQASDNDNFNHDTTGYTPSEFEQSDDVVDYNERHVLMCYKSPEVWPSRIEDGEFDRLPRLLSAALAARKRDITPQTRLILFEGDEGTESSEDGDVLIFPDMIMYRCLTHFDVEDFVEEVFVKNGEWLPGSPEALRGNYIFVCSHGTRHMQCGFVGPDVVARFKEEIESHGLQKNVLVRSCSHIGGKNYAGNVMIYGTSINGEATGQWYGYVTPNDVPELVKQHIVKGEVVDWLWRGQMSLSEADKKKCQEGMVQANKGSNTDKIIIGSSQKLSYPKQVENFDGNDEEFSIEMNKETKKHVSKSDSHKGSSSSKKKVYSMPTWYECWEKEDTCALLSVVAAAISVTVAYTCYKQLN